MIDEEKRPRYGKGEAEKGQKPRRQKNLASQARSIERPRKQRYCACARAKLADLRPDERKTDEKERTIFRITAFASCASSCTLEVRSRLLVPTKKVELAVNYSPRDGIYLVVHPLTGSLFTATMKSRIQLCNEGFKDSLPQLLRTQTSGIRLPQPRRPERASSRGLPQKGRVGRRRRPLPMPRRCT